MGSFPLVQHIDKKRKRKEKKEDPRHFFFSEHTDDFFFFFWLVWPGFHQMRRAEAKPLSPALLMTAHCCATVLRYLLVFPLPACCFTLSTSCTSAAVRGWHRYLATASFTEDLLLLIKHERGGSKTCFKISFIYSNILCFCCHMQLLSTRTLRWHYKDYVAA